MTLPSMTDLNPRESDLVLAVLARAACLGIFGKVEVVEVRDALLP